MTEQHQPHGFAARGVAGAAASAHRCRQRPCRPRGTLGTVSRRLPSTRLATYLRVLGVMADDGTLIVSSEELADGRGRRFGEAAQGSVLPGPQRGPRRRLRRDPAARPHRGGARPRPRPPRGARRRRQPRSCARRIRRIRPPRLHDGRACSTGTRPRRQSASAGCGARRRRTGDGVPDLEATIGVIATPDERGPGRVRPARRRPACAASSASPRSRWRSPTTSRSVGSTWPWRCRFCRSTAPATRSIVDAAIRGSGASTRNGSVSGRECSSGRDFAP